MSGEDSLHRTVVQYLTLVLPADVFWFHPPNGEYRSKRTAAKLKAFGVRAGVPDLCFAYRGKFYAIELKAPGTLQGNRMVGRGYCSADQRECHAALSRAGTEVAVCWSLDDVQFVLRKWGMIERRAAA